MLSLNGLRRASAAAAILMFLLLPRFARAQVLYGSIVGSLQDETGAALPEASVTITNTETGQMREGKSDAQGNFNITNVLTGRYDVRVAATGFRAVTQQNLEVSAGTVSRADFRLQVGQVSESIEVSAAATQLQTDKAGTQAQITTKPVEALPLSAYRNYQALINLVPGAAPAGTQNSATDTPGGHSQRILTELRRT